MTASTVKDSLDRDPQPQAIILTAPSGAGKTRLAHALTRDRAAAFSVSHTTRAPRGGEVQGRDYHFVDDERFQAMVDAGEFLEHARVFDCRYGTSRGAVREILDAGQDAILDIDWQGAQQVRKALPDAIGVFILPPSIAELRRRLMQRGQDLPTIERRMREVSSTIEHCSEFDHVVINDDFDGARAALSAILDESHEGRYASGRREAVALAAALIEDAMRSVI
ncbi:guanylate kinase [Thioalkalivibrio sp. HK1]|uniref:guanylate kinase n=1 Tax=Thioalkalivibrio sp. HK1 TaxID=1469245 RepID=UPI00046E650B|nr:guanylate kinase [Thioalkalivibrio sp. HK1]